MFFLLAVNGKLYQGFIELQVPSMIDFRSGKKLVKGTLDSRIIRKPSHKVVQNMCMDKGYDFPDIRELIDDYVYTAHIRKRGNENIRKKEIPGYRTRRWVVERTNSWLNRFRRLLIRWEKKSEITLWSYI